MKAARLHDLTPRALTALVLTGIAVAAFCSLQPVLFATLLAGLLVYVVVVEWPRFNLWWLTLWYPVLPFLALIDLYLRASNLWAFVVITVAVYDTGAYLAGSLWGRDKIAPSISPGKTWQGLLGGLVFCIISGFVTPFILQKLSLSDTLTLPVVAGAVGIIAFLGDFFESYLKRLSNIKDSGDLLPGHGGVLDRIDGLLFATMLIDIMVCFF